ncbi:MAG: serine/threonine protein kinase [Sandaracinaceae bacterium]|nr:serine/threonine protein kinase [Sandaracinaceae bacterium]
MTAQIGTYELIRKIAAGGMAEIFLARQWAESSGFFRDVVIKRLFPHLAEHERQLRMFMDEARLLSQLAHPNIPQVYEVGYEAPHWFIAMEYVEGLTVADLWRLGAKSGQLMPMNVAIAVIVQACEALHHAHERQDRAGRDLRIVHRDVTPHNIMLNRDGVVKLMDFGVAATSARKDTEAGAVRGTFAYMAPEQVRGRPLDKRADVFALGVVLYELTTGTRLYRGSDVQIMTAVVEQDAPPPSTRVPGYPTDLEEIVRAALQRDRSSRIPSAAHLAMYLEELAMRNGMLIGPRSIARYFTGVAPAEPIREEALGIVERPEPRLEVVPDSEARAIWGPEDDSLPEIDERALLDDLQLLSVPTDVFEEGPIDDADTTGRQDLAALDALLDKQDPASGEIVDVTGDEPGLVLEDLAEDPERPVVLLDEASRKSSRPKGDDYVTELERRLAGENDE